MSLWAKAQSLQGEALQQIKALYGDHFPIEVRHFLAIWIEENMNKFDPDNQQHERYAHNMFSAFLQELESKAESFVTDDLFLSKQKLEEAARAFRVHYSQNPLALFRMIRNCLVTEMQLTGEGMSLGMKSPDMVPDIRGVQFMLQLNQFRSRMQTVKKDLDILKEKKESFALHYHECNNWNSYVWHMQSNPLSTQYVEAEERLRLMKLNLNQEVSKLHRLQEQLASNLKETVEGLESLQSRILGEELVHWKREQQLANNGARFNNNLDCIQDWCESLAAIIWTTRQQIKELEELNQSLGIKSSNTPDILPELSEKIAQLLSLLVKNAFVIEKQPPQVLKTNTKFTSTVRLLFGGALNVHMNPPQVKVTIISEVQAKTLLENNKIINREESSGEILNNTGTMEYHKATRKLTAKFRNMQLKKIKRAEKKGTESVTDEKFSVLFSSKFSVGGEVNIPVYTLSLPVVVIVHGNQEPHAWATVTWANAFSKPSQIPFIVPEEVHLSEIIKTMNSKFTAATGRSLSEENMNLLTEKAFSFRTQAEGDTNMHFPWSQFCKEHLRGQNYTFWEWFYAAMKLTKEHLKGPWANGLILGFVDKEAAKLMLSTSVIGTFLLRFSDSEPGGITIAWVGGKAELSEVFMLQPFTSKDLGIRPLADRISDLPQLKYLYRGKDQKPLCKEQAFSEFCSRNQPTPINGYITPQLVTHIPLMSEQPGLNNINNISPPDTTQAMLRPATLEATRFSEAVSSVNSMSEDISTHAGLEVDSEDGRSNSMYSDSNMELSNSPMPIMDLEELTLFLSGITQDVEMQQN